MKFAPRSKQFDDVYFSVEDGLAETTHVFLDGNNLPAAWKDKPSFTIAETGFGTGLNFLAAWKLFKETATPDQSLHFISIEKFPLTAEEIRPALDQWNFGDILEDMLTHYPQNFTHENIRLTLIQGDVNDIMPELNDPVDCWFLDGFKPSTNPDMWTATLFQNMARLSRPGATLATFTAAGFVRRGLQEAGFAIHKAPGFGRKREMIVGKKL